MNKLNVADVFNESLRTTWSIEPPKFYTQLFKQRRFKLLRNRMGINDFNSFINDNKCVFLNHDFRTDTYSQFSKTFSLAAIELVTYSYRFKDVDCDYLVIFVPSKYLDKAQTTGLVNNSYLLEDGKTYMVTLKLTDFLVREEGSSLTPVFIKEFFSDKPPEYYLKLRGHKPPKKEIELVTAGGAYFYNTPQTLLTGTPLKASLTNITGQLMVAVKDNPNFKFTEILVVVSSKVIGELDNTRFYPLYDINKGRNTVIGLNYHELTFMG